MQLLQSFIHLKDIRLKGYHGVLPQEKSRGKRLYHQPFNWYRLI